MDAGIVGLGRMGLNMSRRLVRGGHTITGYNRTDQPIKDAQKEGIRGEYSLSALVGALKAPRVVWIMVPAGEAVDATIEELKGLLSKGDTIVDGGNSYYRDDIRRFESLKAQGINYMDAGVSGGIWGLENGYCLMLGGEKPLFDALEPLFKTLAPPDGYLYCGGPGAGHFVKMVHNGIEYGMMEAYAEGFELIKASPYGGGVDNARVAHLWNRGSVVRSWLLELLEGAFSREDGLGSLKGYVEDSGEGRWMVKEGVDLGVSLPVIAASLFRRFRSRENDPFGEKVLAALRQEFGGHAVRYEKK